MQYSLSFSEKAGGYPVNEENMYIAHTLSIQIALYANTCACMQTHTHTHTHTSRHTAVCHVAQETGAHNIVSTLTGTTKSRFSYISDSMMSYPNGGSLHSWKGHISNLKKITVYPR